MHTLQLAGVVFSREKLLAAQKRITHLEAVLGPLSLVNRKTTSLDLPPPDSRQIEQICADPELAGIFYAGQQGMPAQVPPALPLYDPAGAMIGNLVLYRDGSESTRP